MTSDIQAPGATSAHPRVVKIFQNVHSYLFGQQRKMLLLEMEILLEAETFR